MKIAFVSTSSPRNEGGAAVSTRLIVQGLEKKGVNVDVFSQTGIHYKLTQEAEGRFKIPAGGIYSSHHRIGKIMSAARYLPDLSKYDVIHVYGTAPLPGVILRTIVKQNSPPVIATANTLAWICTNWTHYLQQGCPKFDFKNILKYTWIQNYPPYLFAPKVGMELVGRTLSQRADHYTVQTSGMAEILSNCGYDKQKIDVVPNLLDERFDLSSSSPDQTLLYAGRLIKRKGIDDILDAFLDIESDLTECWDFKILGKGKLEPKLRQQVSGKSNISLEYVPYADLPEVYRDASVLVHGSKYPEPFSRTWLEALASETAIVASENPSSRTVLSECAELYDPYDLDSLRSTLRSVLKNEAKRERMRKQGKEHVKNFQAEKVTQEYITLYEDILNQD